jgi:UDP-N-acetyl-D-mannosaminuronic acid transferase (WecB/TagA/CpsF family)
MLFCNINFNQKNKQSLFDLPDNRLKLIVTVNAAFIIEANRDKRFFDILNNNYVTFDGTVPYLAAKLISKIGLLKQHD